MVGILKGGKHLYWREYSCWGPHGPVGPRKHTHPISASEINLIKILVFLEREAVSIDYMCINNIFFYGYFIGKK